MKLSSSFEKRDEQNKKRITLFQQYFVLYSIRIQLMQEYVAEDVRGLVGGVQQSLNASFNLVPYALGLIISDPEDFHVYVATGYAAVAMAVLAFVVGMIRTRGEL